jgi:hypothetical protein
MKQTDELWTGKVHSKQAARYSHSFGLGLQLCLSHGISCGSLPTGHCFSESHPRMTPESMEYLLKIKIPGASQDSAKSRHLWRVPMGVYISTYTG